MGILLALMLQLGVPTLISTAFLGTEVTVYWDVELDGRPSTQEWVVNATGFGPHYGMLRNVQLPGANGGLCVGPWFDPRPESLRTVPVRARLAMVRGRTWVTGEAPTAGVTFGGPLLPPTTCS